MSKQGGLGSRFLVGGYDLSGDIQALDSLKASTALLDVTDITEEAHERLGGLRDGSLGFTAYFDAANAHPVLGALPTADQLMTALLPSLAVGSAAFCCNAKQVNYDPNRAADGALTLKVEGGANGSAAEWGVLLTPGLRTDTSATGTGTDLDNAASTAYGGQGYLQVTAFTGTSVTVDIEHSADNSSWSSLASFTAVDAAPATQRLVVSNATTVDRYLRVITTGTFTLATFAVVFDRNEAAGVVF